MGIEGGEIKTESISNYTAGEIFPNLGKEMVNQEQEAFGTPNS
jgi:hypothetical protein